MTAVVAQPSLGLTWPAIHVLLLFYAEPRRSFQPRVRRRAGPPSAGAAARAVGSGHESRSRPEPRAEGLVALEARLGQALDDVAAGRWEAEEAERSLRALTAQARKDAAFETLEQAVREAGDGEAFEKLTERLDDWYSERSVEREFTDKPVAEIILGACKALGITPDPALLTDEAMSQTLADAVRAYAAAFKATPQAAAFFAGAPDAWSPPAARRPNAIAEARPPPPG
jgi:hypothetical protein